MKKIVFSVIICSIDAGKFSRISECYRSLFGEVAFETIGIHDAKSLAEGYNRGIRQARGEILIFSHDDILISDAQFVTKVKSHLHRFDLLGFAGATKLVNGHWFGAKQPFLRGVVAHARPKQNHITLDLFGVTDWPVVGGIKAVDGLCIIAKREVTDAINFDDIRFDGFHLYDLDFSFGAYLAGFNLGVCCDIPIIHESVGHFDSENQRFCERFVTKYANHLDHPAENHVAEDTGSAKLGRCALFQDIDSLRRTWQRDILMRSTLALHRQYPLATQS